MVRSACRVSLVLGIVLLVGVAPGSAREPATLRLVPLVVPPALRVAPLVGGPHSSIFVRYTGAGIDTADDPGGDFVFLHGPAGEGYACTHPLIHQHYEYPLAKGRITLEIGPGAHRYPPDTGGNRTHISISILTRAWCPGVYHGEVDHGYGDTTSPPVSSVYGKFKFRIVGHAKR